MNRLFQRRLISIISLLVIVACSGPAPAARTFTLASYNVENLFDAVYDGTEYDDYVPGSTQGWNKKMADIKTANTAEAIGAINADIVCLQEVESKIALKNLLTRLNTPKQRYPFYAIAQTPTPVRCALVSTFPIVHTQDIVPGEGQRAILKAVLSIDKKHLTVFICHWKSKSGPESRRIPYAAALRKAIEKLPPNTDFVITGDFNANYNEHQTFADVARFNDTQGVTGINHVIKTLHNDALVDEKILADSRNELLLYNLWLELPEYRRWSYNFFGKKESPDNMLVPRSLYDKKGIDYVDNSFDRVHADLFFDNNRVYRWQRADRGKGRHLGKGYSDHLPIRATFTTSP
ncbi:endonuclease/exonuclease/phosphatase family protein [Desulfosudis oleivorans]|uniref:Endonuclease/exonuclease/phosphatase n=1 Tax=Desulfosudis oleivorans (strain DSM 6200 / JCM 39069 / Hxd3) TaxID=96561 RepID=A8ZWY1_DESOH|nr:endonuclease/exonuclease/phosphatase family protein [Desulfosudis oleivorans]ABW66837.1 Endonuclease/exonuclease/phosphatase [Desulfosudis oleivorans Hxd3]